VSSDVVDVGELGARWQERWPRCRPIGHELRGCARATWVRFHTLPGSKRYADDDGEYAEILRRHHLLLAEIPGPGKLLVITVAWSASREQQLAAALPDATYWMPVLADRSDTGLESWVHLYVSMSCWQDGELDPLLRLVADDQTHGVIIAPPDLAWLYHPYDGGADLITSCKGERGAVAARHRDWLPASPAGL
jgi:hypothetical protein